MSIPALPPQRSFPLAGLLLAAAVLGCEEERHVAVDPLADLTPLDQHLWVRAVSRRRQPVAESAQSVTVLDVEDRSLSPAPTLPDRLRYVPGVDVYQARHGQYDIGLRGLGGLNTPRTIALLNGREFAFDLFGSVPWVGYVHDSDITRVEVLKGPASVTYGASAFGGAISLATREPDDRWRTHSVGALGSYGHEHVDITALGPLGSVGEIPFALKVSAGHSARDDLPAVTGLDAGGGFARSGRSGIDDLTARRASISLSAEPLAQSRLTLDYRYYDLDEWEMIEDLSPGSNLVMIERHDVGLRFDTELIALDYQRSYADIDYHNQIAVYLPQEDFKYIQVGSDEVRDTARGQLDLERGAHHVSLGAEYTRWESESNVWAADGSYDDRSTWDQVATENLAGYVEHQWNPTSPWSVTTGLRLDRHELVGTNFSPRASFNRRLDDGFVRLSFLSGYRLPTPFETYAKEYYFTTDEDIEAETIASVDLEWQTVREDVSYGLIGFYNRVNGTPLFQPRSAAQMSAAWNAWLAGLATGDFSQQPGPLFELRNLDNPVQVYGMEAKAAWRPSTNWELWGNLTWQRYRHLDPVVFRGGGFVGLDPAVGAPRTLYDFDTELPRDVNGPPPLKAAFGATWRCGGVFIGSALRMVDERTVFSIPNSHLKDGELAVQTVPSYTCLDLSVGYREEFSPDRRAHVSLSILNLFDDRHYETYRADAADLVADEEEQYSSAIVRTLVLSASFDF
ncbi:MAG: TonB-dependent receptor plug domain-containing protein [Planctomycetota bacterium]